MSSYRPWLDGVRGVSILLVITEHLPLIGKPAWNFGGTGVGIFFVLSGYLISGLLLTEFESNGRIALKSFYLRRAARLMPALLLVVLVFDLLFFALGWHDEILASFVALAYLTNYATVIAGHYLPGYGHTWSLAVEEHFYLLWPLALIGMLKRGSLAFAFRATLTICVAVFVWRLILDIASGPSRLWYVGSVERADTLLYGCAAAIAVLKGWKPRILMFYAGVSMVVMHLVFPHHYPHLLPLLLGIGSAWMIATLDHASSGWGRSIFMFRPLVWLGALSYGVYLWHGVVFHTLHKLGHRQPIELAAGLAFAIFASWLSYRYVETPIRDFARNRYGVGVGQRPSLK